MKICFFKISKLTMNHVSKLFIIILIIVYSNSVYSNVVINDIIVHPKEYLIVQSNLYGCYGPYGWFNEFEMQLQYQGNSEIIIPDGQMQVQYKSIFTYDISNVNSGSLMSICGYSLSWGDYPCTYYDFECENQLNNPVNCFDTIFNNTYIEYDYLTANSAQIEIVIDTNINLNETYVIWEIDGILANNYSDVTDRLKFTQENLNDTITVCGNVVTKLDSQFYCQEICETIYPFINQNCGYDFEYFLTNNGYQLSFDYDSTLYGSMNFDWICNQVYFGNNEESLPLNNELVDFDNEV